MYTYTRTTYIYAGDSSKHPKFFAIDQVHLNVSEKHRMLGVFEAHDSFFSLFHASDVVNRSDPVLSNAFWGLNYGQVPLVIEGMSFQFDDGSGTCVCMYECVYKWSVW
jgi:hypothetical protein